MACCFPRKEKEKEKLASSDFVPEMSLYDIRTIGAKYRIIEPILERCRLLHTIAAFRINFDNRPKNDRPRKAAAKRARMRRECAALQQMRARVTRSETPPPPA